MTTTTVVVISSAGIMGCSAAFHLAQTRSPVSTIRKATAA
jgi:glycine/D-amino acid oxidase-like deaminating enzyme